MTTRTRSEIVRDDYESVIDSLPKNPLNLLGHVAACLPCTEDEDALIPLERKAEFVDAECVMVESHMSTYDAGGIGGLESFVHCTENVSLELVEASARRQSGVDSNHRRSRISRMAICQLART